MNYVVNEGCIGCGMCNSLCPSVFSMNEEGLAEAIEEDIPEEDFGKAEEAMNNCPVGVIEQR